MTASDVTTGTDREEFEARYREHRDGVYSQLLSRTHNAHLAEDLTATAFTKAWEHRERFDGQNFGGWVWTIARNTHLDHVKSSAAQREVPAGGHPDRGEFPDRVAKVGDVADLVAVRDQIKRLTEPLTDEQREVLTHRYIEDRMHRDVGAAMGISEHSAIRRDHNALAASRTALSNTPMERKAEQVTDQRLPATGGGIEYGTATHPNAPWFTESDRALANQIMNERLAELGLTAASDDQREEVLRWEHTHAPSSADADEAVAG